MRNPQWMALAVVALLLGLIEMGSPSPAVAQALEPAADVAQPASKTATQLARWVLASDDNRGLPFVIIDKVAAEVFVFDADGQLQGAAAALLGVARGDDSVPGIGDRKLAAIRPEERTTPAGRFLSSFGPAPGQRDVFWVDYATAISLHPVVTSNRKEHRLRRLQTPSPEDNRITFGCINVAAAFYDEVVRKTFNRKRGVVYILPETRPLDEVFPRFRLQAWASSAPTGAPTDAFDLRSGAEAGSRTPPPP
jgi:hypothetical protein